MTLSSIDRDVFQHEIASIAEEMSVALRRAAYSPIIWDMIDYACGLLDGNGQLIGQAPTIPAQLGIMSTAFRHIAGVIPPDQWHSGDIIICNDPYAGCSHTPDIVLFSPVIVHGRLIAVTSTVAHHVDVGGPVPGTENATAIEVFGEGLIIPPLKLYDRGRLDHNLLAMIRRNLRDPLASTGDLNAQIAACRTGERRVADLVGKYGTDEFLALKAAVQDHSHAFIRRALAPYQGKEATAEILIEDDAASARPMRLQVAVTIGDGTLSADFTGTEAQRPNGLNCPLASTISMAHYAVQAVFAPDQLLNDGFNRAITLLLPEDSLINPRAPAAVSCRHLTEQAVADVLLKALAQIAPGLSTAGSQISFPTFGIGGFDRRREGPPAYFVTGDILGGGMGAGEGHDGASGVDCHGSNCALISAEIMEMTGPMRVASTRLVPGSGGLGAATGGLAIERAYEALDDDLTISGYLQQTAGQTVPWGVDGGEAGAPARAWIERFAGKVNDLPSKYIGVTMNRGDRLFLRSAGGAGWGSASATNPGTEKNHNGQ
jgi:N-methylhydantoinase B